MSDVAVRSFLGRYAQDQAFRQWLQQDPTGPLFEYDLTLDEMKAVVRRLRRADARRNAPSRNAPATRR